MVETSLSQTKLTKIITIYPRFVIINRLNYPIMFREFDPTSAVKSRKNGVVQKPDEVGENSPLLSAPRATVEGSAVSTAWKKLGPDEVS